MTGRRLLAVGLIAALLTGCGGTAGTPTAAPRGGQPVGRAGPVVAGTAGPVVAGSPADPTSPAAIRWGTAPQPQPGVTLQPDVVIVGGGGTSIRNATEDGLTYYLDPAAPRADELAPGKVMFVTGRAVGRVIDARRAGADLAVTIGPVELTEVIADADFGGSSSPVSLQAPISYPAGAPFWAVDPKPDQGNEAGPQGLRRAGLALDPSPPVLPPLPATANLPAVPGRAAQPVPSVGPLGQQIGSSALRLSPVCCEGGVGTHFSYDKGGVRMVGNVSLTLSRPRVDFVLRIRGGSVTEAGLQISGGSGLTLDFTAARQNSDLQINEKVAIPLDFSVPLTVFGIPLSAVVNQWVVVKTAFSAKTGVIKANGKYSFKAALGFSYRNGAFSANAPTSLTVDQSMTDSLDGLSIGAAGVVLSYQARFLVGLGTFGFTAGVYFGLTASVGVTRGSDAGVFAPGTGGTQRVVCRGVNISLFVNYGIGYSIPKPMADLINVFRKVFQADPIERAGGIGRSAKVFDKGTFTPDLKVCGGSI